MRRHRFTEAEIAALLAIQNPIERAAAITTAGRTRRLPPVLENRRKADIAHGRTKHAKRELSELVGLGHSGISRLAPLTRLTKPATS